MRQDPEDQGAVPRRALRRLSGRPLRLETQGATTTVVGRSQITEWHGRLSARLPFTGLVSLLASVALLMAGTGLLGTLIGVRGSLEGFGVATLGVIMAGFYAGFLIGSYGTPRLITRVGHIRVFAALAATAAAAAVAAAVFVGPLPWLVLRTLGGSCIAGLFVVVESWLSGESPAHRRGSVLGAYMTVLLGAMAAGQMLLNTFDPRGFELFVLASILVSLAVVPTTLSPSSGPVVSTPTPIRTRDVVSAAPLAAVAVFAHGVVMAVLVSMTPVLGTRLGESTTLISLLVAAIVLASMAVQFPVGWLSDRTDRRYVIAASALLAAGSSAFGAMIVLDATPWSLMAALAAIGAFSGPLYALALAHLADYLHGDAVTSASSRLVMLQGLGASTGPLVVGALLGSVGPRGFFWLLCGVQIMVAAYSGVRILRRAAVDEKDRADFAPVAPEFTPQAVVALDFEDRPPTAP